VRLNHVASIIVNASRFARLERGEMPTALKLRPMPDGIRAPRNLRIPVPCLGVRASGTL